MTWTEIEIEIARESAEAVTAILLEHGCKGVAEVGEDPLLIKGHLPPVDGAETSLEEIEAALVDLATYGLSSPLHLRVHGVEEADWATEWKRHYVPMEIGRRLLIKPTWTECPANTGRAVVELDPGMAFGTGGHPTTRLCLEALDDFVKPGDIVADIGTGSGILALAAARLGAAHVYACDVDPLPVQVARENVAGNGLSGVVDVLSKEDFDAQAPPCSLVVANILASTVMEIAPAVLDRLLPSGLFIASGIVDEKLNEVLDCFSSVGLAVEEVRQQEVWRCVIARRPA